MKAKITILSLMALFFATFLSIAQTRISVTADAKEAGVYVAPDGTLKTMYLTMTQARALTGTVKLKTIYITDSGKEGIFRYDSTDTASADDSAMIFRIGARRYKYVNEMGYVNVRRFGAKGDGTTDNAAAFTKLMNYVQSGMTVFFPYSANAYVTTQPIKIKPGVSYVGVGSGSKIKANGCHAFNLPSGLGAYINSITFDNLVLEGDAVNVLTYNAAKRGINFDVAGSEVYFCYFNRLKITNFAGEGIYSKLDFNIQINDCFVNACGGHGIELWGGPATKLTNCYVGRVGPYKAGYRVHGNAHFDTCNGVEKANSTEIAADTMYKHISAYWCLIGETNAQGRFKFTQCNFEAFTHTAIKSSGYVPGLRMSLETCSFIPDNVGGFDYYVDIHTEYPGSVIASSTFDYATTARTSISGTKIHFRFPGRHPIIYLPVDPATYHFYATDAANNRMDLATISTSYVFLNHQVALDN